LMEDPAGILEATMVINNTSLALKDLSFFDRELEKNQFYRILAKAPINFTGSFQLADSRLGFSGITISQDHNFGIELSGTSDHPFQPEKSRSDLRLEVPFMGTNWLKEMLAGFGLVDLNPEFVTLSLKSTLSDGYRAQDFNLELASGLGNMGLSGSFNLRTDTFSLNAAFDRLMLEGILAVPDLGPMSGSGEIAGTGLNQRKPDATLVILIDSLSFREYDYTRTRIEGSISSEVMDFHILADDPSFKMNLDASVNRGDSALMVNANTTLFAQLDKLHLYSDTLGLEGNVIASFKKEPDALETEVMIEEMELTNPRDRATIGPINAFLRIDTSRSILTGNGSFFNTSIRIDKPISELGTLLEGYRDYLNTFVNREHESDATRVSLLPEMSASASVTYHDALGILIPDTSLHFAYLDFALLNRSQDQTFHYDLKGTGLEFKMVKIGSLYASMTDSAGFLDLQVTADNNFIFSNPVNKLLIKSSIADWKTLTDLTVINDRNQIVYNLDLSARVDSNQLTVTIPSRELILNRKHWDLDNPSLLSVDLAAKKVDPDLRMHTDSSTLQIFTTQETGMHHFQVDLGNVALSSLLWNEVIPGEPSGFLSGSLDYGLNEGAGKNLNTDLHISQASWHDLNFGRIDIQGILEADQGEYYSVDMSARLDSAQINMKIDNPQDGNRTVNSKFSAIPIHTFQPFVRDYLSDLKGTISGTFNISSRRDTENFGGSLTFDGANLRINTLDSRFKIPRDSVKFEGKKMVFNHFRILDSLNSELLVDGYVDFSNNKSITTDLQVSSSRLQVMNRQDDEDATFYGDIFLDSRLSLKGPVTSPVIKGRILLTGGTEIFYRHTEDLSLSESEKIVVFASLASDEDEEMAPYTGSLTVINRPSVETMVEIDPSTRINFNLSKKIFNIDLMIVGGGLLNYQMLNNNQVNLSGTYTISEGTAEVKMIGWPNKTFRISKGGFVRWDGLVEDPELKFEAVNRIRTSYINPVDGQRREVDFNVVLQLSNRLSELEILFTVNTPDQYLMSIINTLSPEEQMRQAITVLLFENIDLPGISTSSDYMSQQVNQLVASQMNQLTKTTIKGIDISFGIDSYQQTTQSGGEETKTSLSYEVRKGLFNNRAQLEISGRLNDVNKQPGASDLSLNNISVEYRLDSAATRFLKIYNEHTYEDVFDGEVVSTGVGLTYRKRYRTFGEIWKRENRNRKTRKGNQ
jgi:translocation and assembly module TamB